MKEKYKKKLEKLRKFDKDSRSSFAYWWNHWLAFQYVALGYGVWKFKYIFHDSYKPWIKLFGMPYEKLQKFHRTHSRHHLEWAYDHYWIGVDWEAMVIDWECSRFTKLAAQLNARDTMELEIKNHSEYEIALRTYFEPILLRLGL